MCLAHHVAAGPLKIRKIEPPTVSVTVVHCASFSTISVSWYSLAPSESLLVGERLNPLRHGVEGAG